MTEYKVSWHALHIDIIKANSKEEASKIAEQMAEMDETYVTITDGPLVDEPSEV